MQLLRRMQTSLGSWLPSETPPMSGGLPFPPSCTTLLLPPPLLAPRSCESLCKTLRLTCCLTAPPSSPPCRGSPCTLLRCCQPAAHCQAGLVWHSSLLQLPPKPGHRLHQALPIVSDHSGTVLPPELEEQGGSQPAKAGWVWAAATMALEAALCWCCPLALSVRSFWQALYFLSNTPSHPGGTAAKNPPKAR